MSPRDWQAHVTGCGGPGCASRSGPARARGRQVGPRRSAGRPRPAPGAPAAHPSLAGRRPRRGPSRLRRIGTWLDSISRAPELLGGYTFRAGPCSTLVLMEKPGHRLNVTLDPEHAARLARLAERTHVQEGPLARSLLSVAIEEADPEARNIVAESS